MCLMLWLQRLSVAVQAKLCPQYYYYYEFIVVMFIKFSLQNRHLMRWICLRILASCLIIANEVSSECIQPPVVDGCPLLSVQFMCYVEHLWLIDGQFYAESLKTTKSGSLRDSVDSLPFEFRVGQESKVSIRPLDSSRHFLIQASEVWKGVLTVIHHRIYPHNYAHMLRDTLPHDLFAFRRFHTETWNVQTIRQNLRMLYLDGEKTQHPGYRIHSEFAPWERSQQELGFNMYFERAVIGHWGALPLDGCKRHYFSPNDWDQYSDFIARATLGFVPRRDPALVWLANRNRDEGRQMTRGEELAVQLKRANFTIVTTRPSELPAWVDQIRLAKQASVIMGPHGSNLANIIIAGSNATVLELLSHELLSGWYYQQCEYQGSRWVSYPTNIESVCGQATANADDIAPILRKIFRNNEDGRRPVCQNGFFDQYQICSLL